MKKKIDWSSAIKRAERERDRNIARIEAGETYRAHQQSTRKSPSQKRETR